MSSQRFKISRKNLEFKKNLLLLEKKAANLILFVLTAIFFFLSLKNDS